MTTTTLFVLVFLALVVGFVVLRTIPVLHSYFRYRGKRLVNCPETLKAEAVDVAARTAAASAFVGWRTLRLDRCSRWPERQNCGQACLKQIAADPETVSCGISCRTGILRGVVSVVVSVLARCIVSIMRLP